MILFVKAALICFGIVFVWFNIVNSIIIFLHKEVKSTYSSLNTLLLKRYLLISDMLTNAGKCINLDSDVNNIKELIAELKQLGDNLENADRRIALEGELIRRLKLVMCTNELTPELIDEVHSYNEKQEEIIRAIKIYNASAQRLLNTILVFPYSFVARLKRVKSVNLFYDYEDITLPCTSKQLLQV